MTSYREFEISLDDGVTLSCAERGSATGHPLILLHGMSDSWRSFVPLLDALPIGIQAIAISLRGHGDSAKPRSRYDMAEFAGDVIGVMDALSIERAVILGHSLGSLVAQYLAISRPERVEALMLLGAFATLKGNAPAEQLWSDVMENLEDPVDRAFIREFQESTLAQPVPSAFLEMVIAESSKLPAHVWRAAWHALITEDRRQELPRIAARTLLIWGDQDAYVARAEQDLLVRAIPGAWLSVHEGAGHALHWENPKAVAADIQLMFREPLRLAA